MAMHLAGVTTAVASCGTAFGDEHLSMLRRLMMDDNFFRGELIYVFDGDAAGRAAALKAFDGEHRIPSRSVVRSRRRRRYGPVRSSAQAGRYGALRDLVARSHAVVRIRHPHSAFRDRPGYRRGPGLGIAALRADGRQDRDPTPATRTPPACGWVGWDDVGQVIARVRETAKGGQTRQRPGPAPATTAAAATGPTGGDPSAGPGVIPPSGHAARRSRPRCSTRRWRGRCSTRWPSRASPSGLCGGVQGHRGRRGTASSPGGAQWIDAVRQQAGRWG